MKYMRAASVIIFLLAMSVICACGSDDSGEGEGEGDAEAENDGDASESGEGEGDAEAEVESDGDGEIAGEDEAELESDVEEPLLPDSFDISYTRADVGEPLSEQEIHDFTMKVMAFLKKVHYFDYVLYTTHGVDASTGKRDWQFWYSEHFRKDGDLVTFYHPENLNDGGHNLHIPFSRVLGDVIAAYMLTGDDTAGLAAEKLCKGMTASMLGMVKDENDTVHHLMTRNVVAFNHEFLTHDGKRKAVDYSGWFSEYDRWNCSRFPYENNPYWGKVWVTNTRSKDDVPHIFRLVPIMRYVAEYAADENVKSACTEARDMLETWAKDIVDSDYRIRTKDKNGDIYIPGYTDDPELNKQQGDLASFINYREYIPEGECNARRGAELIGYHSPLVEDCGRGEPNSYDDLAFAINSYNKRICRYFHLAHIANALTNRDNAAAELLMDGLEERMAEEFALPEKDMQTEPENYRSALALYLIQSHTFGYPLTSEEARMVQYYYEKAVDNFLTWPYWDPWAESVPEGDLGSYRPGSCADGENGRECWFAVEDMAQLFETCWSPFVNPASAQFVDCDIVRDPARWDESVLEK